MPQSRLPALSSPAHSWTPPPSLVGAMVRPANFCAVTAARELLAHAATALIDERRQLTMDEMAELAALPSEHTAALAALAHEVRLAWCGPMVEVEGILSVKTG